MLSWNRILNKSDDEPTELSIPWAFDPWCQVLTESTGFISGSYSEGKFGLSNLFTYFLEIIY